MSSSTQSQTGGAQAGGAQTTGAQTAGATYTSSEAKYLAVQQTPEFQELRRRYRGWVLPVAAASLAWYFLYVALAAYATDFMAEPLIGNINVGLVLGLLQFVSTFGVTALYIRYANRVLDPVSERIRTEFEAGR